MLLSAAVKLCVLGIQELVQVSAGDMTSVETLTYGLQQRDSAALGHEFIFFEAYLCVKDVLHLNPFLI